MRYAMLTAGGLLLASVALAADFEAVPAPYQTVPRPAEGETIAANPPCFVYPATPVGPAYVVECSRDAQFPPETTLRLAGPYLLAVPTQTLPAGEYVWRWRPGTPADGATEWSAVRRFTVPSGVPEVPFPDVGRLVQRLGTSRPRIGVNAAELQEVRQQARERFGAEGLASVRQTAERLRDKALLPEPAFLPDAKDPKRVEIYQKTFMATRPFMREMVILGENYLLTGDELSGQEAVTKDGVRINVYYTTGTVGTCLEHPTQGRTQMFRRNVTLAELEGIFRYPRVHTGKGYKQRVSMPVTSSVSAGGALQRGQ